MSLLPEDGAPFRILVGLIGAAASVAVTLVAFSLSLAQPNLFSALAILGGFGGAFLLSGWYGRPGLSGWALALAAAVIGCVLGGFLGGLPFLTFGALFGPMFAVAMLAEPTALFVWSLCFIIGNFLVIRMRRSR